MGVGVGEKYWKLEEGMNSYCVLDTKVNALDVRKCIGVWLILIHPSASADASAVKSAGFFQYTGQILLE